MSGTWMTSTGHAVSFESARAEYENALRFVGIKPGWTVLDASCGSGGYVPLMCEHVGPTGRVAALDLAPENVARVATIDPGQSKFEGVNCGLGWLSKINSQDGRAASWRWNGRAVQG